MKKFDISVTGFKTPFSQDYTIEAINRKSAKAKAERLFRRDNVDDDGNFDFDWIKIKTLWEYKEKK